ncbi:uncharacterized protein G2W53_023507 [Senna tora]|uniref:Uncharacterized protein n=1 Tax=Senna tora TaxID=362788 RepID=A0A834TA85_9FABA|nr:uncharacterized protein G2W53_023507 [Senna tora]
MEFFTIEVHYGGKLVGEPTFAYEGGHTGWLEVAGILSSPESCCCRSLPVAECR